MPRVLLIIGGGIAAYKVLEVIRRLRDQDVAVRPVLTAGGAEFITPLSVASLAGDHCYQDLFSLTDEAAMGHIRLSREADLVVVAPATADLMAKMANGHANDLASTTLLATDKPVLIAPAMNPMMWQHPATLRNVAQLAADGVALVGPNAGDMACGEDGPGRMAEPAEIVTAILDRLRGDAGQLAGRRAVVTSGPTHEPLDPVRYLTNRSSGRQGHAIALALAAAGAEVTLVTGPVTLTDPPGIRTHHVETAEEMYQAVMAALPSDIAVFAAAVADWRPSVLATSKLKKRAGEGPPVISLEPNTDILATVAGLGVDRPYLVIGFAAETDNVLVHAEAKLKRKGCDWIVANDVSPATGVFGGEANTVHLLAAPDRVESWPSMSKEAVAARLVERIASTLNPEVPSGP